MRIRCIMKFFRRTSGSLLLLAVAALLPRIFTLGRAFTTDEAYHWQHRAPEFLQAVLTGRFADTILTGHPGVTTMWLGAFGILIEQGFQRLGVLGAEVPFETHLTLLRLPLAICTAGAVLVGYLLLRRLLGSTIALVAGLLWATDPFLVAHSRVLHLDALLSFLMLLATLALLLACFTANGPRPRPHLPLVMLASLFTGLALVTKAPGVLLLPIGGLILVGWACGSWWSATEGRQGVVVRQPALGIRAQPFPRRHNLAAIRYQGSQVIIIGLLWLAGAALVAFVTWPALWVVPNVAIERVVREVIDNGGAPMHWGNFLLGQSEKDPGLLYYIVTLAGRTTPWTAVGLLALFVAAVARRATMPKQWLVLLLVVLAMALFVAAMSVTAKKADRYALPAVPLLLVLGATGLVWLGQRLPLLARRGVTALVAVAATATLVWLHPYYLAYFSPLVGGSAGAAAVVPIGWGEGLDVVADWLNQQPDITQGKVATWSPPTLKPYLKTDTTWQGGLSSGEANYLVVYVAQAQSGKEGQYFGSYYPTCKPLQVIQLRGIDYAWIYRVNQRRNDELEARFGDTLELGGYDLLTPDTCTSPGKIKLTLRLVPHQQPSAQLFLFLHTIDANGTKVDEQNLPLQGIIPPDAWQGGAAVPYTIELPFPANAAPGVYRLIAGVFDVTTGQRVPIDTGPTPAAEQDGPDTLNLATFTVSKP